jgi:AraC-like DNA-binding protein
MYQGLLYIGFAQCVFAAFMMITLRQRRTHERLMTWWLCVMAAKFLVTIAEDFHSEYFDAGFSEGLIPFTFGPFLYLYTRFLADEDARFRLSDLKHFIPFFLYTLIYFIFFRESLTFTGADFFRHDDLLWARIVFAISFIISIAVYSVLTFIQIRQFLNTFRHKFSFESGKSRILWMRFITILYTVTHGLYIIAGVINAISFEVIINVDYLSSIGLIILAYSVSYYTLREKRLVRINRLKESVLQHEEATNTLLQQSMPSESVSAHSDASDISPVTFLDTENAEIKTQPELQKKQLMSDEQLQAGIQKLLAFMEKNKPYLNPELTIQELAEKMNIPKHHLTYIINTGLHKNFFNFINEYRVEEFKRRALDPENDHLTLLAIAFDCGFSSKSSFHNIFKNVTGQTPSEFKKNASAGK